MAKTVFVAWGAPIFRAGVVSKLSSIPIFHKCSPRLCVHIPASCCAWSDNSAVSSCTIELGQGAFMRCRERGDFCISRTAGGECRVDDGRPVDFGFLVYNAFYSFQNI